jgi:hypothetical protein
MYLTGSAPQPDFAQEAKIDEIVANYKEKARKKGIADWSRLLWEAFAKHGNVDPRAVAQEARCARLTEYAEPAHTGLSV